MPHPITEPAASVILTGAVDNPGAAVVGLQTGCTSDYVFDGRPHSKISVIATCADGERVTVAVPGTVDGLTPQRVQEAVRTLNFIRVKFTGLTLEAKGDTYNKLSWSGTAEKAEVITPAASALGAKS